MSEAHHDLGPELRKLVEAILDGIDPAVRAAAALTARGAAGTGKCRQVWCPVCALAALAAGEEHPMLTAIAEHSIALLDVIRAMVDDLERSVDRSGDPAASPPDGPPGDGLAAEPDAGTPTGNGAAKTRYQPIPITVEE